VKRRLISADARLFRLFDAATRAGRARSFSRWAVAVLVREGAAELERIGIDWSYAKGRPLDARRKLDRNVLKSAAGIRAARARVMKPRKKGKK
jgi:hypothetical protein